MIDPRFANAIAAIESSGRYDALGPQNSKGNRPYGKYQVMDFNIGPWTQQALGRSLSPDEFLKNPEAQDAVFNQQFGASLDKYGNPQDAASVWFSGRPLAKAGNASDVLGTTVPGYVDKFNKQLGQQPTSGATDFSASARQPGPPTDITPPPQSFSMEDAVKGYDWGNGLTGAGAALQSIDNPRGGAVLAQLNAQTNKAAKKTFSGTYDAKSGTYFRLGSDGTVEFLKNPNASNEPEKPKFTEKALQNATEGVEKYGTIAQINKEAADIRDDLETGKLDLGMFKNWMNSGRNMAGLSDEQSRTYAKYQQFLQKLANDQLLLNKGVQTEGDAYREMKALASGGANFDNETAKQAIDKVLDRGKEAVMQRGRAGLKAHIDTYGAEPFKSLSEQADRWQGIYDDIDNRRAGYGKKQQEAPKASGSFKIINVR